MKCLTWGALALLFSVPALGQVINIPGTTNATQINGGTVPASAPGLATGPTGQLITATPPTNGQASGAVQAADGAGNVRAATPKEIQAAGSDTTHNTEIMFGQATTGPGAGTDVCTIPAANQGAICWYAGQISYYNFATSSWSPLINGTSSNSSTAYILTDPDGNKYQVETAQGVLTEIPYTGTATASASILLADSSGTPETLTSVYGVPTFTPSSGTGAASITVADLISGTSTLTSYQGNSTSTH